MKEKTWKHESNLGYSYTRKSLTENSPGRLVNLIKNIYSFIQYKPII